MFEYRQIYQQKRRVFTKDRENLFAEEAVVHCTGCGEELYNGDSAYFLDGKYYCTACVDDGFTVVRCDGSDEYDENGDE